MRKLRQGRTISNFWIQRFEAAELARRPWFKVQQASMEVYDGVSRILDEPSADEIEFNTSYSAEENIFASLDLEEWRARPIAGKPEKEKGAHALGSLLNWSFREGNYLEAMEEQIQNARIRGLGFLKIAWSVPFLYDPARESDKNLDAKLAAIRRAFPIEQVGRPCSTAWNVDSEDVLVDPDARNWREARWIDHRLLVSREQLDHFFKSSLFEGSLDDLREWKDTLYSDTERRRRALNFRNRWRDSTGPRLAGGKGGALEDDLIAIHETYDREEGEVLYQILGNKPLLRTDFNIQAEGLPIFPLAFTKKPWRLWPFPAMHWYSSAQQLLNKLVSIYASHVNRFGKVLIGVPEGTEEDTKDLISKATSGEVFEFAGPNPPVPISFGVIPGDVPNLISLSREIVHQISGVTALAQGIAPKGQTATGIAALETGYGARLGKDRRQVKRMMSRAARYTAQLLQEFAPSSTTVPLLGLDAPAWEEVKREDIQGEYEYEIIVGQEVEQATAQRRKQKDELYSLTRQDPWTNAPELLGDVFEEHGMKRERFVKQMPPPELAGMPGMEGGGEPGAPPGGVPYGRGREGAPGPNGGAQRVPQTPAVSRDMLNRSGEEVAVASLLKSFQRKKTGK